MASTTGNRAGRPGRFLPPDPRVEEPYLFSPRMALRVAILGVVALVVFAVLFLRLWSLQILSGTKYEAAALNNQLRTLRVEAPRGPILDRYGRTLVTNVGATAVDLWPVDLPKQGRYAEMKQLANVLHMPLPKLLARLERGKSNPLTPITVQVAVHEDQVAYLREHAREFPGVHTRLTYLRKYNTEALLAHVLGYTGEITAAQLKRLHKAGRLRARRHDRPVGRRGRLRPEPPRPGRDHRRARRRPRRPPGPDPARAAGRRRQGGAADDRHLAPAGDRAGARERDPAGARGQPLARGRRRRVAMNPNTGEILAMASSPTFKPSVFGGRTVPKKLAPLLNPAVARKDNYPGLDRATDGLYPPGSTFKPVTALAAMETRLFSPFQPIQCTPSFAVKDASGKVTQVFKNWDPFVNEPMTLPQALGASCDTYFYNLGYAFYALPSNRGHPLQGWASRFGFGAKTGIDVGAEQGGLLPTPEWRQSTYTKKTDPCCWQIDRLWKPGDSIQLAIGQKDLLVTPLQMTRFYAMIANGGYLVTPHVVSAVEEPGSPSRRARCSSSSIRRSRSR